MSRPTCDSCCNTMKNVPDYCAECFAMSRFVHPYGVDNVNKPKHYNTYQSEVIDMIRDALTEEQFRGYLLGNMLKYRLRAGLKEDVGLDLEKKRKEDLDKSNWYQDKLKCLDERTA